MNDVELIYEAYRRLNEADVSSGESAKILIPRKSFKERDEALKKIISRKIQNYIKSGGVGNLDLTRLNLKKDALPNGLRVGGDLKLQHTNLLELPVNLTVEGNLDLTDVPIRDLPAGLKVGNHLVCKFKDIRELPKDLIVGGDLDLLGCKSLNNFPETVKVGGSICLIQSTAINLPTNFKVNGDLDLSYTPISSIPERLTVEGNLNLRNTLINDLPKSLNVSGNLRIAGSPISKKYTEEELKSMLPNVRGTIYCN